MAPDDQQPTVVEPQTPEAPSQDDQEWEAAAQDYKAEAGLKPEEKKPNEDPKVPKDPETPATPGAEDNKSPEGEANPEEAVAAPAPQDTTIRDQRAVQREILEDQRVMKEDIRKEMFADLEKENQLVDSDGDPINKPEDLLGIVNPNTKEPFTLAEATAYLLQWRQSADAKINEAEKQIEQIADTQLSVKDQAENVLTKYGELLKEKPELGKALWDQYEATLEKNEESGIIIKAPVSLEKLADLALGPHQEALEARKAAQPATPAPVAPTAEELAEQAKQKDAEKKQTRSDRADIIGGGKTETMDEEEKEWAKVAKEHYES